jgi:AcrR family transcriptional regulator
MTTTSEAFNTPRTDDPRVERTRAAVIEAASDLLVADGPSAITHANVATAANVSRTTVYTHWPTQADLLRDTIESLGKVPIRPDQLTGSLRPDLGLLCEQIVNDLADEQRAPMIVNMMERALHDPTVALVRDEFLGDVVGGARHVGEEFGVAVAVARDEHPELGPFGVGGHRGEDGPSLEVRRLGVAVQREEVIPRPDRIDAERLGAPPCVTEFDVRGGLRMELNADVEGHATSEAGGQPANRRLGAIPGGPVPPRT